MFHKILVAIDTSNISKRVFSEALALAKATEGRLLLVYVLSPFDEVALHPVFLGPDSAYPGIHTQALQNYLQQWQQYEKEGLAMLRSLSMQAAEVGVSAEFSQNSGDPGRTICRLAEAWDADLIMIGRRGRTGFSELLLGSVSNYVVHHAPCSVLTVQGAEHPEAIEEETSTVTSDSCELTSAPSSKV